MEESEMGERGSESVKGSVNEVINMRRRGRGGKNKVSSSLSLSLSLISY